MNEHKAENVALLTAPITAPSDAIRHAALQDARRAAVKAVMETGISRADAFVTGPQCHKKNCHCSTDSDLDALVTLVLTRAADEVTRALILERDEDAARIDHQRVAWDEGYMHVMKHGTGRNTRGQNPYREADDE